MQMLHTANVARSRPACNTFSLDRNLTMVSQFGFVIFYLVYFQLENKRTIESANRELERKAALFKHDLKEVSNYLSCVVCS